MQHFMCEIVTSIVMCMKSGVIQGYARDVR
jgi:hypothetical protein